MNNIDKNSPASDSESSRIYSLFYSFFLIPLMMVVFGVLFYLLFAVITEEPDDINQLLIKLETGSIRDKAMTNLTVRYERELLNPEEALRLGSVSKLVMPGFSRKVLGNALLYLLRHYQPSPMVGTQRE